MREPLQDVLKQFNIPFCEHVSTATLSTFRIGGPATLVIEPRCQGELITSACLCKRRDIPFAMIGAGSNTLFSDERIDTVLIRTGAVDGIRICGNSAVADCGVLLPRLCARVAQHGFGDLAFACGIPGTLGGALLMNAGAHGHSVSEIVHSVTAYYPEKNKIETRFNHELNYSYRNSAFQEENAVILSATLKLCKLAEPCAVLAEMDALRKERNRTQPIEFPNAGSVFRRPLPDFPISRVLDELGLKGTQIGMAAVSQKHAGFIVNLGGARAADVKELIEHIQNIVEKERGIRPRIELRFIPNKA